MSNYNETQGTRSLRKKLEAGYRANAERDLEIAAEWFPLDDEAAASIMVEKPLKARSNSKSK